MSWYPNTKSIQDNGFGGSRNGSPINGVVIHHVAGTNGLSYVANKNSRNSHPTYHVANDGSVTGIVNPDRRPYSTGGQPDPSAVTFEVDNSSTGGDWPVSSAAVEALIDVIVYHASKSPRAGKGFAKNIKNQTQSEFFVAWHSQYVATACPGPFLTSQLDYIVAECNKRANSAPAKPAPSKPTAKPISKPSSIETIAREVIAGKWGNGPTRVQNLTGAGHDAKSVQAMVNQILKGNVPSAPAKPAPSKTGSKPPLSGWLRVGSTGASVKYVQAALGITQDGIFGKITERRVREFQRAQGLLVDGIVGPITYGRL
jgi:hypothetical protein